MSSSFSGINTALSALYAQRRALDVTGQNVANANTEGYSRQRLGMQATGAPTVGAIYSTWTGSGSGVEINGVNRVRDGFLESRGRAEHAQSEYLATRNGVYTQIQNAVSEPSDTALQSQLADYWSAWHDVTNNPGDLAARSQLLQRGAMVADGLHAANQSMGSQWDTQRTQLEAYATEINTSATTVAQLNQAIQRQQAAGLPVNELSDQRDLQIMHLAELAGVSTAEHPDGTVDVMLGGASLVNGARARTVATAGSADMAGNVGANAAHLRWTDLSDTAIPVSGGKVAGVLDALNSILPGMVSSLDTVAASLAQTVNDQHALGYGLDGMNGRPFFSGSTAGDLAVAITDPAEIAASASPTQTLDASNADALADLARMTTGPDAIYRQSIANLGVAAQTAQRRSDIQASLTSAVDGARESDSGVNIDEEMTNMLQYQRAYEAASRLMTTIDETLDVLINRTGIGR